MAIRVLVVDDHILFRDGMVSLLIAAEYDVVGEASNGLDAVVRARKLCPDLILLDISMPEMNGLEALKRIHKELPDTKIVMLTASDEDADLVRAVKAGACGYLLKDLKTDDFLAKLEGLQCGKTPMSNAMVGRLMNSLSGHAQRPTSNGHFTKREMELLQLIAKGFSNQEIAQKLHISKNTVKYHVKNILQKNNFQNRTEAAAYAIQMGLLTKEAGENK